MAEFQCKHDCGKCWLLGDGGRRDCRIEEQENCAIRLLAERADAAEKRVAELLDAGEKLSRALGNLLYDYPQIPTDLICDVRREWKRANG